MFIKRSASHFKNFPWKSKSTPNIQSSVPRQEEFKKIEKFIQKFN